MAKDLLRELQDTAETPLQPATDADLQKREQEIAAEREKHGKLYYIDFECWRVRGMDEGDAIERARAIQLRAKGRVPVIASTDEVGDDATTEYTGDDIIEAKTPFEPASKEEVTAREGAHRKEFSAAAAKYMQDPNHCPFCPGGKGGIIGGEWEGEFNQAWREIHCEDCGRSWREIFTISDIEELD